MEIMILAKSSLLWNLLTNVDPVFSLFTVAPPPAVVFPLLPSATAGLTHHRNPSTSGDRRPCDRSWAYPDQSFLLCNPHRERHVEQRPLCLCSLPLPALQSTTKMWRRHSRRSVCTCVSENSTLEGRTLHWFPVASPRLEVYYGQPALKTGRPLPSRLTRLAPRLQALPKTTKAKAAGLGRHARGTSRPDSRPARLPQCGWNRGLCAAAQRGRAAAATAVLRRRSGEAGTGSVSAGITAGSPRKMDSVRRCALSAVLLLHQLSQ
ncbi:uncharacterized protein LOC127061070 [Serinus canaria]|uniref:uncharacterized protein LOC127061070 n=1 Tax=Serinus canaria TaxID=9135 RepID=UPI0021CC5DF3|nr:uncharacterized protein LOC127061070 [Serinus canaria]